MFAQPPILRDIPDHFETERLLIRVPRAGDGPALLDAIQESIVELREWMDWALPDQTLERIEAVVRRAHADFLRRDEMMLLLFRKEDSHLIGSSGLHNIDWHVPRFEIGYWARTSEWRKGYITEAVRGITGFAFEVLGAQRVEIRCDDHNTRSAAVAERAGFTLEGRLRAQALATSGGLRDTLIYALIRSEWQGHP